MEQEIGVQVPAPQPVGIGYLALLLVLLSFQQNVRGKVLFFLLFAQILFTLHFSLLHAWTGAAMNGIAALQAYVFYNRDIKH